MDRMESSEKVTQPLVRQYSCMTLGLNNMFQNHGTSPANACQLGSAKDQGVLRFCQKLMPSQDGNVFVNVRFVMLLQNMWISLFVLVLVNMNISDLNEIHFSCFGFIPNNQFTFPVRALGLREREMVSEIFWLKINFRLIEFWADPTQPQIPPFLVHSHPKCKMSACLISPQLQSTLRWRPTIDVAFQGGPRTHLKYSTILSSVCCSLSIYLTLSPTEYVSQSLIWEFPPVGLKMFHSSADHSILF